MTIILSYEKRYRRWVKRWVYFLFNLAIRRPKKSRTEDYREHWGMTSYKGKTILDLGADYGSTANFFLDNGASHIYAVEGHPLWGFGLHLMFGKHPDVTCFIKMVDAKDIQTLLLLKPDIVKCDIEGDEKHLLNINLSVVPEWLVEAHSYDLVKQLTYVFRFYNFKIETYPLARNCIVIHAKLWDQT